MASSSRKYWFASKYGFGWYPASIKGTLIVLLYFAYLIYMFVKIDAYSPSASDTLMGLFPHLFGATILLLFICYLTGEPLKVRKLKL